MAQKYSTGFKEQALELVRETSVKEVSARLGVTDKTLYRWQQAKRLGSASFRGIRRLAKPSEGIAQGG